MSLSEPMSLVGSYGRSAIGRTENSAPWVWWGAASRRQPSRRCILAYTRYSY
jgi:hypothetical protein